MDISSANKNRILVVGAGGIGCELLKNLVLTNFTEIDVVNISVFF
jgi:molybdopterin/thiamine biosynthesis adenylyltransferase